MNGFYNPDFFDPAFFDTAFVDAGGVRVVFGSPGEAIGGDRSIRKDHPLYEKPGTLSGKYR